MKELLKHKAIIPVAVIASVTGAGLFGVGVANAATEKEQADPFGAAFVQKIADRFKLDKAEVQKVVDETKAEEQKEREAVFTERLDQAVKDGKLTEAQKSAIVTKREEIKTKLEALKDTLRSERKAAMGSIHQEVEAWAKANNLDLHWAMPGLHIGGSPRGDGLPRHMIQSE